MRFRNKKLEQYEFEWDGLSKKIYLIPVKVKPLTGHLIMEGIPTEEEARRCATFWVGGYIAKERELAEPRLAKHRRILAETGHHSLFGITLFGR